MGKKTKIIFITSMILIGVGCYSVGYKNGKNKERSECMKVLNRIKTKIQEAGK